MNGSIDTVPGIDHDEKPLPMAPDLSVRLALERLGVNRRSLAWGDLVAWAAQEPRQSPTFFATAYVLHLARRMLQGMALEDAARLRGILATDTAVVTVPELRAGYRPAPHEGRA